MITDIVNPMQKFVVILESVGNYNEFPKSIWVKA